LRKCDGYIYLDLLASLSICLFIACTMYPMIDQVRLDRKNMELRMEAHYVLYEKLLDYMDGTIEAESTELEKQHHTYTITWREHREFPNLLEGCIHYQNAYRKKETFCDVVQK
jgi:competence protein ComGE